MNSVVVAFVELLLLPWSSPRDAFGRMHLPARWTYCSANASYQCNGLLANVGGWSLGMNSSHPLFYHVKLRKRIDISIVRFVEKYRQKIDDSPAPV